MGGQAERPHDHDDPLHGAVESYLKRRRNGEKPSVDDYIDRFPGREEEVRELFSTLELIEDAGSTGQEEAEEERRARSFTAFNGTAIRTIGDYHIIREIGRGGMGVVYEATQGSLGRKVALKILPFSSTMDEKLLERFHREAKAAARLHHTNIVPVFGAGEENGVYYYVMQFINGQTLSEVLTEVRKLQADHGLKHTDAGASSAERPHAENAASRLTDSAHETTPSESKAPYYRNIAAIGMQVASALHYAHASGVLHRDIKPSNLILDADGSVWITDFGLAKTTGDEEITFSGDLMGTLPFMAPERFRSWSDPRSDIYSLGITLYQMVTLKPAFSSSSRGSLIKKITTEDPVPPRKLIPHLPRDLETIILKAIEKEPESRYQTAQAMEEDLEAFAADKPITARRISPVERMWRWCRRNRAISLLSAVTVLLFFFSGVGFYIAYLSDRAEKEAHFWRCLSQAREVSRSGKPGRVFSSLTFLKQSVDLLPNLALTPEERAERIFEMRNDLIACETRTDLRIAVTLPTFSSSGAAAMIELLGRLVNRNGSSKKTPYFQRIRCSPDFSRYAEGFQNGTVLLHRLSDGKAISRLPGEGTAATRFFFSPDGRFLAVVYRNRNDAALKIWTLENEEIVFCVPQGIRRQAFAFHPESRHCAFCETEGIIKVCSIEGAGKPREIELQWRAPVYAIVFQSKGDRFAVCFENELSQQVHIMDTGNGMLLHRLDHPDKVQGISWNPQGTMLAAACHDTNIYLWNTTTGEQSGMLKGHEAEVYNVAFNHRGDLLSSRSWDNTLRFWNPYSHRLLLTTYCKMRRGPYFSGDDTLLGQSVEGDIVSIWEAASYRMCRSLYGHQEIGKGPNWVRISPNGRLLASVSGDGIRFWDLFSQRETAHLPVFRGPHDAVHFFPSGKALLTGTSSGMYIWPMELKRGNTDDVVHIGPPERLALPGSSSNSWFSLRHDGKAIAFIKGQRGYIFSLESRKTTRLQQEHKGIDHIVLSPDKRWAATSTWGGAEVKIWNAATGALEHTIASVIDARIAFSPDGKWFALSAAKTNRVYNVTSWKQEFLFERENRGNLPGPLAFTGDSAMLAMTDAPDTITVVSLKTWKELFNLRAPEEHILMSLAFAPDGSTLAAATQKHVIQVWDIRHIRSRLERFGLDRDLPPYPGRRAENGGKDIDHTLRVELDGGELAPQIPKNRTAMLRRLNQQITAEPDNAGHHQQRALIHEALGELEKAHADLTRVLETGGDRVSALDNRARINFFLGRRPDAVSDYRTIASIASQSSLEGYAYKMMAWMHVAGPAENSDAEAALPLAEKAVDLVPGDSDAFNTLGIVHYRLGKYKEAVEALHHSIELSRQETAYDLFFLSLAYRKLERNKEALAAFRKGVEWCNTRHKLSAKAIELLNLCRREAEAALGITR